LINSPRLTQQPTSSRGSTKPRRAIKPSKIRDVNFIAIDNSSLNFQARQQCLRLQLSPATHVCGAFYFTHMSFAAPQYLSAFGPKRTKVDFGLRWFVRL
jgi:hypothetical protein